jgi:RNA recognition motif-containing protein
MVEQSEITPYGGNSRENTYGMAQSSWKDSNNPDGHQFDEAFVIEKPAIKLRGLPFSVTEDDIVQFFHGYNLIESSIKIGRYANGKLTGDGSVLFDSSLDAKQAFTEKYKHNIGSRYIELFQITQ